MKCPITILLADPDEYCGAEMKRQLIKQGYKVTLTHGGGSAGQIFRRSPHDLCMIDVMLPDKNGFETARAIRRYNDLVPILLTSQRNKDDELIRGFECGADCYLPNPCNFEELLLRIGVFIKRSRPPYHRKRTHFHLGFGIFDAEKSKLLSGAGGCLFQYTPKEREVLRILCENANKVIRREELLYYVWGKDDFFFGRSMDVVVNTIRKTLADQSTVTIETVHGVGFRLVAKHPI